MEVKTYAELSEDQKINIYCMLVEIAKGKHDYPISEAYKHLYEIDVIKKG